MGRVGWRFFKSRLIIFFSAAVFGSGVIRPAPKGRNVAASSKKAPGFENIPTAAHLSKSGTTLANDAPLT